MSVDRARKDAAEARELPAKLPAAYLGQNMEYAHPGTGHWMGKARTMLATLADHVDVLVSELEAAQKERDEFAAIIADALDEVSGVAAYQEAIDLLRQLSEWDALNIDPPEWPWGDWPSRWKAEVDRVLASAATPTKENNEKGTA